MHEQVSSDDAAPATIRVQFMGRPSDVFGAERILPLSADGASLSVIRRRLADSLEDRGGAILIGPAIRGGVEDEIVPDTTWVSPGQTVFFFSVVSGG